MIFGCHSNIIPEQNSFNIISSERAVDTFRDVANVCLHVLPINIEAISKRSKYSVPQG